MEQREAKGNKKSDHQPAGVEPPDQGSVLGKFDGARCELVRYRENG
jgi:hypothetical protein